MELRRGSLVLAVLAGLRKEQCGYTLRKTLEEQGMAIDEGTLYPLLRRLEAQGLLNSEWRPADLRDFCARRRTADCVLPDSRWSLGHRGTRGRVSAGCGGCESDCFLHVDDNGGGVSSDVGGQSSAADSRAEEWERINGRCRSSRGTAFLRRVAQARPRAGVDLYLIGEM
jgi:Transcriptional regulator PadR-like family